MNSDHDRVSSGWLFVVDTLSMRQTVLPLDPTAARQSIIVSVTYPGSPSVSPVQPELLVSEVQVDPLSPVGWAPDALDAGAGIV